MSDVVGIILLPFLLAFIFPKLRHHSLYITALFFSFWKSSYSEELIEIYNRISPISIYRVVDYTDLFALIFLLVTYYFIKNQDKIRLKLSIFREIEKSEYYIIDSLKVEDEIIKEIKFYMCDFDDNKKGKSTGLNVGSLKSDRNLREKKVERSLKKIYKEALRSEFLIN